MARTIRCQIFDTFFLWLIFIKKYVFDMKKIIRLTESDLHEIIKSSAKAVNLSIVTENGVDNLTKIY